MNKEKLNELLEMDEDDFQQKDIDKKVKRQMRKQIYLRVIIILVVLAVVWQGIYHGTSFVLDYTNYQPMNENSIVVTEDTNDLQGFHVLMATYVNMFYPGKVYMMGNYEKQGFGKYVVSAKIQDLKNRLYADGVTNVTYTIDRSELTVDTNENDMFVRTISEYYDESASEEYKKFIDEEGAYSFSKKDIEELPDSAVLDVSLSFQHANTLEETITFINRYQDSRFVWIATHVENQIAEGFSLYDAEAYEINNEAQYPNFYLDLEDYTAQQLTDHYLSKLRLLKDHPEFISLLSSWGFNISSEWLEDKYNEIEKNGIHAIGLRGYVKKQDLLKMIENNEVYYVYINDVNLSSLQK